jgi:hypothetical protein
MLRALLAVVIVCIAVSPAHGKVLAEWDFDELGSSTTLHDRAGAATGLQSGTGVSVVKSGAGFPGATGFNNAYQFEGNSNAVYVRVDTSRVDGGISALGTGPFTIAGWFDAEERNKGDNHRWIYGNLGQSGGVVISLGKPASASTRGKLHAILGAGPNQVTFQSEQRYDLTADEKQWHWFAVTADGTTMSVYVDGTRLGSVAYQPGTTAKPDDNSNALIGRAFDGRIDQLSIHDSQLSATLSGDELTGGELYDLWRQSVTERAQPADQVSVRTQEVVVFDGEKGWEHNGITYRLACGVNLVQAANGELMMTWLSGTDSEPSTDNCILVARSSDGGWTWSQPEIMVPAGENAGGMTNIFQGDQGQMVALGAHWPVEDEYMTWYYFRQESYDNGRTWSAEEPFTLWNNRACLGRRIKLDDGRWLYPASVFIPRDRPLHGDFEHLAKARNETEAVALEAVFPEPNKDKFARVLHGCMAFLSDDMSGNNLEPGGLVSNRPMGLIEPSVVQLNDGTVVMLMRAQVGGFLWESRSYDRGQTWTPAEQTNIPNPSALAFVLKLNNGDIALFNNPTGGKLGGYGPRDPLAMWVSNDDMKSWAIKQVIASGARCAYPMAIETEDGRLLVAYDRDRRQVRLIHVGFE